MLRGRKFERIFMDDVEMFGCESFFVQPCTQLPQQTFGGGRLLLTGTSGEKTMGFSLCHNLNNFEKYA